MEFQGVRFADGPTVEVSVHVEASPEAVWKVISDPTIVPQEGNEVVEVGWLEGQAPSVGASFSGRNRHRLIGEWTTTSYIVDYQPLHRFSWAVGSVESPAASWGFVIEEGEGGGVDLSQWCTLGPGPSGLTEAIRSMPDKEEKVVFVRMREHENSMQATLQAFKSLIEKQA